MTIQYAAASFVNPVSSVAIGCPVIPVVAAIKETVIDLCERAQVWKYTHPDVSLLLDTYQYAFVPPADTVVSKVETARLTDADDFLSILDSVAAYRSYPRHPDVDSPGRPKVLFQLDQRNFQVIDIPDGSYTLRLSVTLKPTESATGADDVVMEEHKQTILHGALHKLLLQQGRAWFNKELAAYHGKQYSYYLNTAKAVARKGFTNTNLQVFQQPFA